MRRPTLKGQIDLDEKIDNMTDEELEKFFSPVTMLGSQRLDLWVDSHSELLWRILHWCWFDSSEGSENADEHRSWYMKLKRKLFGGNKKG